MKSKSFFLVVGILFGVVVCFIYLTLSSPLTLSDRAVSTFRPVSIEDIYCQIDDFTQTNSQTEVPIKIQAGMNTNQVPPPVVVIDDVQASVVYEQGDQYESQKYLSLSLRHGTSYVNSTMYDYVPKWNSGPINVVYFEQDGKTIRLQCAFTDTE